MSVGASRLVLQDIAGSANHDVRARTLRAFRVTGCRPSAMAPRGGKVGARVPNDTGLQACTRRASAPSEQSERSTVQEGSAAESHDIVGFRGSFVQMLGTLRLRMRPYDFETARGELFDGTLLIF